MAASITFSELLATVLPDYMKNLADNFFVGTPTLAYLTKAGANIEVRSGERLVFPSIFQGGNSKWVTPYTQLEITNRRQIDGAQFTWRVLAGTTEITSTEKKASGPPCEIIPFVDAKLKVAETDCRQSFNTSIN